jgi:hypothetical protein
MVFVGIGERGGVRSHAAIDRSGLAVGNCGDVFSRICLGRCRVATVDDAYLTAQAATVRERLKMAGVRLGAILNTALTPG